MTTNPSPAVKDIDRNDYFQLDTLLRAADIDIGDATTRDQGVALFVSITYSVRRGAVRVRHLLGKACPSPTR